MSETMSREQLAKAASLATKRAERDAADMYPEGPDRERKVAELQQRYYLQYVTPPIADPRAALATERAARAAAEYRVSRLRDAVTIVCNSRRYNKRRAEAAVAHLSALRSRCEGLAGSAVRGVVTECCGHSHLAHDYENERDPLAQFQDREVIVIPVDQLRELLATNNQETQ